MIILEHNYIGCDISKDRLDFFDPAAGRHRQVANSQSAIAAYLATLDAGRDFVVMEATGSHDRLLRHALADAGIAFARCNPAHTHFYARSGPGGSKVGRAKIGQAKTDRLDAVMLADYGRSRQPPADPAPDEAIEHLQALNHRRDQLVEDRARNKKQLRLAFDAFIAADIATQIAFLEDHIKIIEKAIRAALKAMGEPAGYDLLVSAPGVSLVTAATLIAQMPELGKRSPKTIAALAGLAPIDDQSGKTRHRSRIRGGRHRVRHALYMAALGAIRANQRFTAAYKAIADRSKSKKLAIIAVARKLLVTLNAMIRDRKRFA